jgi:hypothetical protein
VRRRPGLIGGWCRRGREGGKGGREGGEKKCLPARRLRLFGGWCRRGHAAYRSSPNILTDHLEGEEREREGGREGGRREKKRIRITIGEHE